MHLVLPEATQIYFSVPIAIRLNKVLPRDWVLFYTCIFYTKQLVIVFQEKSVAREHFSRVLLAMIENRSSPVTCSTACKITSIISNISEMLITLISADLIIS